MTGESVQAVSGVKKDMEMNMAGHKRKITKRQRKKRKIILVIVEIIILVVLLVGLFFSSKLNLIQRIALDDSRIQKADLDEETKKMLHGYTDIAMFGLDNRDIDNYGHGNSDVIMIFSINNETEEIRMVSVYRDTYLEVSDVDDPDTAFSKANSAYARGGAERAVSMLNKNLDLDIDEYVTFDFSAVADAIDILGGVEVEIDEAEAEWMPTYIENTGKILGRESEIISTPGTYNLDGIQAVAYSRIRYTAGNDYKRAERQRLVFSKMMAKAKKADLGTLTKLMDKVFPNISTSLSQSQMLSMVRLMLGYDLSNSRGFPFHKTTVKIRGADSVIPCDLVTNVSELHEYLYNETDYQPSQKVQNYNTQIISESGKTAEDAVDDEFSESDDFTGSGSDSDSSNTED